VSFHGSLITLTFAALLLCIGVSQAQQPKIARIGYISGSGSTTDQGPYVEALRSGLRDLGHVEGKTFVIEYRGAEGKLVDL
jgi:putative ABC transport system substrate-binding protein